MLVGGRSPDEIAGIQVSPKISEHLSKELHTWPLPSLVTVAGHEPALWLKAAEPEQKKKVSVHAGRASPGLWFQLDPLTLKLLHKVRPLTGIAQSWSLLFAAGFKVHDAVKQFLSSASRALGAQDEYFLPRVDDCSLFLRQELAQSWPADIAVSLALTGMHAPRNPTTSYYISISLGAANNYQRAAIKRFDQNENEKMEVEAISCPPGSISTLVIGSRLCPSKSSVEHLREKLLEDARIGRGRLAAHRIADIDRAFTAYCWLFFSLHTGWRSPKQLLPEKEDIEWVSGIFLIEDKRHSGKSRKGSDEGLVNYEFEAELDRENDAHAAGNNSPVDKENQAISKQRWLPLGDRVLAQLRAYYDHVAARDKYTNLKPIISRRKLSSYLKRIPDLHWDLPTNFGRHYLRSAVLSQYSGIEVSDGYLSSEVINAYLGHWNAGAEPWWNGAGLDPVTYSNEILRTLDEVFPQDDWPVLSGFR